MEKVSKEPSGCWRWTGTINNHGYGHFWYLGKVCRVHRVSLILAGVEVPDGMDVDHTCRNRWCVNPEHLRVVTERVNAIENNGSPLAVNAKKTHCPHGHPYSPENTALVPTTGPKGTPLMSRACLTCYPWHWKLAIVPRDPPPKGYTAGGKGKRAGEVHAKGNES